MKRSLASVQGTSGIPQHKRPKHGHDDEGLSEEVRMKFLHLLKTLKQHMFALPFVRLGNTEKAVQITLDDVHENVEKNVYKNIQEIKDSFLRVLEGKVHDGFLQVGGRKLFFRSENIEMMAKYLKKEMEVLYDKECPVSHLKRSSPEDDLSELVGKNHYSILKKLQTRYPRVSEVSLLAKALELSVGSDVDVAKIQEELEATETLASSEGTYGVMVNQKYRSYHFDPSQSHDFSNRKMHHFYVAGYQFYKMVNKQTKAPHPLRGIRNLHDSIESITYIENDQTSRKYNQQKEEFQCTGTATEMLLFHGTSQFSLHKLLTENFSLDSKPLQLIGNTSPRRKVMMM